MPDFLRDEETETRTHSLCLFGVPGITCTSNRRCANCPGAVRTPLYHQRRCPLDIQDEPNLFSPTFSAERKANEVDPNSSKAVQHDEGAALDEISNDIGGISLDGSSSSRTSGPRRSKLLDAGTRGPNTEYRSVSVPHLEIGVKRKADRPESSLRNELADPQGDEVSGTAECVQQNKYKRLFRGPQHTDQALVEGLNSLSIASNEASASHTHDDHPSRGDSSISILQLNRPAGSLRTEQAGAPSVKASFTMEVTERAKSKGDQLDGRSHVKEYLENKPQKIFQDIFQGDEPLSLHHRSWGLNTTLPASLSNILDCGPNMINMQGGCHSGLVSSLGICIPGIGMISDGQGIMPCIDGIYNTNDPKEDGLMALMEIDEASIDQIVE